MECAERERDDDDRDEETEIEVRVQTTVGEQRAGTMRGGEGPEGQRQE